MTEGKQFTPPAPLTVKHDTDEFCSGEETLDTWLRERALDNMAVSASKTYVVCPSGSRKVIGGNCQCSCRLDG